MPDISQSRILIIATHGFEQSELEVPLERLRAAGDASKTVAAICHGPWLLAEADAFVPKIIEEIGEGQEHHARRTAAA